MTEVIKFPMNQNPPIVIGDVSRYQSMYTQDGKLVSHFDMHKYAQKSKAITLRGGVAADGLDWEFEYNLGAAVKEDVIVDEVYHYTKLWKNLDIQADLIADMVVIARTLAPNHYCNRVAIDIETNDGLDKNTFTGNAEKLASKVYNKVSLIPDIYTRAIFWNNNTYKSSWMKDCGLWDAHHFYGMDPYKVPVIRPYVPDAWADINNPIAPFKWQFDTHDSGFEWGSTGDNEMDLNFFTFEGGTPEAFLKFYKKPYPVFLPPPQPEPEPIDEIVPIKIVRTTASAGLNIRSIPSTSSVDIGTLPLNSDVPVVDDSDPSFYEIRGYISRLYVRDLQY